MIIVRHHCNTAIRLDAGDAAGVAFTGNQPPLPVAGESVCSIGGLLYHTDASLWSPFHTPIVANIAKHEISAFVPPQRPFGRPQIIAKAAGQFFYFLSWRHNTFQGRMLLL